MNTLTVLYIVAAVFVAHQAWMYLRGKAAVLKNGVTLSTVAVSYGTREYDIVAYKDQNPQDAALLLRRLEQNTRKLIDHIVTIPQRDKYRFVVLGSAAKEAIENLKQRFPLGKEVGIDELNLTDKEVHEKRILAWTVDKGEGFRVCIRSNRGNGNLADERDIFATLVHELAHAGRTEYENVDSQGRSVHSAEFYEIYDFLLDEAVNIGLSNSNMKRKVSCAGLSVSL